MPTPEQMSSCIYAANRKGQGECLMYDCPVFGDNGYVLGCTAYLLAMALTIKLAKGERIEEDDLN